jgi:glycosyltransferase involved in cell wall biosynthesis
VAATRTRRSRPGAAVGHVAEETGPLRIALVCDWFVPRLGGIELHLRDLALRLTEEGHEVHVITSTPGDDDVEGIRVHRLRAPRVPGADLVYTRGAMRELAHLIRRERYDVVHCHVSIVSPVALGGARAAHRAGIPAVITYHSAIRGLTPIATMVNKVLGCSRWNVVHSAVSGMVSSAVRPLAGTRRIQRLPNAIDVDWWRATPFPSDPRDVRFITVMRLTAKKRPRVLLRAFQRMLTRVGGEHEPRLRIVGDGPERPKLERMIAHYRLQDHVTLLGMRRREEIRELFRHADVFVMPATMESFGIAALEARAAGLPVVAMSETGVADFVTDGREGLLAKSDRHLAHCLEALVRDPELRRSISRHNQETTPPLSWVNVIVRHLRLYSEAIGVKR